MKQGLQRQRRLLAIRSLQADYAAAEVRRSQVEAAEIEEQLRRVRLIAQPDSATLFSGTGGAAAWVLNYAEQELAGVSIDRHSGELQEIDERTAALRQLEEQARREREQIKRVCERLEDQVEYQETVKEQATLDDLFNAALLRRSSLD